MTVKEFSWNKPTDLVENKGDGREELRNKATRFRAQWGSENGTTTDCGPLELTWMPAKCVPGPLVRVQHNLTVMVFRPPHPALPRLGDRHPLPQGGEDCQELPGTGLRH